MRSICGWHYYRIDDGNEEDLAPPRLAAAIKAVYVEREDLVAP